MESSPARRERVVSVFGGSRASEDSQEYQDSYLLGRLLAAQGFALCNGGYLSIMNMQRNHFKGHLVGSGPSSHLTLPDIVRVAEAYGIPTASRIRRAWTNSGWIAG